MKKRDSTCLAIIVIFFVFQLYLYLSPVTRMNVSRSTKTIQGRKHRLPKSINTRETLTPPFPQPTQAKEINCDRTHNFYDICSINGPTVLDPTTSTFFLMDPTISNPQKPMVEKLRPYPRKWESFTMPRIKEVALISGPSSPKCKIQHKAPALVFSAGGYTGNFFHDFNDVFIPLFITVNSVYPDQDVVLVIAKARNWWVSKYIEIIHTFNKYPIIDLDNDNITHCFPSASVGIISHGFMTIDPKLTPNSITFTHFRAFLDKAYGQNQNQNQNYPSKFKHSKSRPILVLASRSGGVGRVLLNQNEVKLEAEKIGFNVIVFEPRTTTPLKESYALINSSHAMIGIHGAALTHSLFLRPGSVFVQVVPLGAEWVSQVCFEKSAKDMGLVYMEYRIKAEESSLIEKYDKDDTMIKDPVAYRGKNWSAEIMSIYLKEQNVKLDLVRFRDYLKEMYKTAKKFMEKEG
ncbi:xylan glycosyltransferase MUCI21 [Quercus suber]|uniref:xylan glycosyltransferase MUCI21 n=1 Tax=Quercus suber TaxID=58331 RepID=UPI0032E01CCF